MTLKRMDNVLIVVDDLEAAKAFFIELGLTLEGETTVEGPLVGSLIGLENVRASLAMLRPPDGHGGIELDKFHTPDAIRLWRSVRLSVVTMRSSAVGGRAHLALGRTRIQAASQRCLKTGWSFP